jgi:hypothetical protein
MRSMESATSSSSVLSVRPSFAVWQELEQVNNSENDWSSFVLTLREKQVRVVAVDGGSAFALALEEVAIQPCFCQRLVLKTLSYHTYRYRTCCSVFYSHHCLRLQMKIMCAQPPLVQGKGCVFLNLAERPFTSEMASEKNVCTAARSRPRLFCVRLILAGAVITSEVSFAFFLLLQYRTTTIAKSNGQ